MIDQRLYPDIKLNNTGYSVATDGCYLVSLLDGLNSKGYNLSVAGLNQSMIDKKAFYGSTAMISSSILPKQMPTIFLEGRNEAWNDANLKKYLADDSYIVLGEVSGKGIGGSGQHFVRIVKADFTSAGKVSMTYINDPWGGLANQKVTTRYNNYGNILSFRVFKVNKGVASMPSTMYTMPSGKQVDLANTESMKVVSNVYDEVVNLQLYVKKTEVDSKISEAKEPLQADIDRLNGELSKSHSELRQEISNREEQVSKLQGRLTDKDNTINDLETKLNEARQNVQTVEVDNPDLVIRVQELETALTKEQEARDEADKAKGRALNEVARLSDLLADSEAKYTNLLKKRATTLPATTVISALWSALWARLRGVEVKLEGEI